MANSWDVAKRWGNRLNTFLDAVVLSPEQIKQRKQAEQSRKKRTRTPSPEPSEVKTRITNVESIHNKQIGKDYLKGHQTMKRHQRLFDWTDPATNHEAIEIVGLNAEQPSGKRTERFKVANQRGIGGSVKDALSGEPLEYSSDIVEWTGINPNRKGLDPYNIKYFSSAQNVYNAIVPQEVKDTLNKDIPHRKEALDALEKFGEEDIIAMLAASGNRKLATDYKKYQNGKKKPEYVDTDITQNNAFDYNDIGIINNTVKDVQALIEKYTPNPQNTSKRDISKEIKDKTNEISISKEQLDAARNAILKIPKNTILHIRKQDNIKAKENWIENLKSQLHTLKQLSRTDPHLSTTTPVQTAFRHYFEDPNSGVFHRLKRLIAQNMGNATEPTDESKENAEQQLELIMFTLGLRWKIDWEQNKVYIVPTLVPVSNESKKFKAYEWGPPEWNIECPPVLAPNFKNDDNMSQDGDSDSE